jgi:hypothetical protein
MNGRTATPARPAGRAHGARRGGPSGRLEVGEYVGQPAGDAAQDVRRAGLKPGLERSFGCEAELLGQVVAQEPGAGSDLARNGMVTLYVAAPGAAPVDGDTEVHSGLDPDPAPATPPQAVVPKAGAPQPKRTRRPRKPGLARRAPQVFETPPAPVTADRALADNVEAPVAEAAPTEDGEEYDEGPLDDLGDEELSHEQFVVHADDVFAGRASRGLPAWRRVYPRRRNARAPGAFRAGWARLTERPWLVRTAGVLLVVGALVAVATTLAGHSARAHSATAIAGVGHQTRAVVVHRSVRPRPLRVNATRPAHRRPRVAVRLRRGVVASPAAPAVPVRRVVARGVTAVSAPVSVVERAPSGPAAAAREFGPEQHGGPFSP